MQGAAGRAGFIPLACHARRQAPPKGCMCHPPKPPCARGRAPVTWATATAVPFACALLGRSSWLDLTPRPSGLDKAARFIALHGIGVAREGAVELPREHEVDRAAHSLHVDRAHAGVRAVARQQPAAVVLRVGVEELLLALG